MQKKNIANQHNFSKPMQKPQKANKVFETPFAKKVYAIVAKIPKGKTMTYGEVAKVAGKPGAARAVGTIMSQNYRPEIPCHRVVRSDGHVGDYNRGGPEAKGEILRREKIR
jgi:O-6-methylguanine DNA methyltransferase